MVAFILHVDKAVALRHKARNLLKVGSQPQCTNYYSKCTGEAICGLGCMDCVSGVHYMY